MKEIWKDIKGYEGYYQVSNLGEVRSLDRTILLTRYGEETSHKKGRILKSSLNGYGYLVLRLNKDGRGKTIKVHHLVWDTFGGKPRNGHKLQVDHIDENKINNRVDNLQLLSHRANLSKGKAKFRDLPTGVWWYSQQKKYASQIQINKKQIHVGYFNNPQEASKAYQKILGGINE